MPEREKTLTQQLLDLVDAAGVPAAAIAREAGVAPYTICRWREGAAKRTSPYLSAARKVANALGYDFDIVTEHSNIKTPRLDRGRRPHEWKREPRNPVHDLVARIDDMRVSRTAALRAAGYADGMLCTRHGTVRTNAHLQTVADIASVVGARLVLRARPDVFGVRQ